MDHVSPMSYECTGIDSFDRLHRDFMDAIADLASTPDHEFAARYQRFVNDAERTFRIEECWMEGLDCSIVLCHREQHARVLGALHNTHSRVMAGDIALGRDVVERLLPLWFTLHMETMDAALAAAMSCTGANAGVIGATRPDMIFATND